MPGYQTLFHQLASSLPLKIVRKHADKITQLEAMYFGVGGFLYDDIDDDYYKLLQREYHLLRQKYRLDHKEMSKAQWKFLRLRPANFPTLRIAQFAALMHNIPNLLSLFLDKDGEELCYYFRGLPSAYWRRHYNFRRTVAEKDCSPGETTLTNLIINTVVPVLAAYAASKDDHRFLDKATRLLQHLPAETNSVISRWDNLSIKCKNAFDSQALIEMHNNFCSRHRCLECNIGAYLVKPPKH